MKLTGWIPLVNNQQWPEVFPTREQAIKRAAKACKAIGWQAVIDAQPVNESIPKEILESLAKYIDPADLP